jgi:hypothetical protein
MSTHTTYFCDWCNQDHDASYDGGASGINYEYPPSDGWAEFGLPYTDSLGYAATSEVHVCSRCLAIPEFEPRPRWTIADWDTTSKENLEKGRKHAEAFDWAQEHLGTYDKRWCSYQGVRQVFNTGGSFGYGYLVGPKLSDGRFSPSDKPIVASVAA